METPATHTAESETFVTEPIASELRSRYLGAGAVVVLAVTSGVALLGGVLLLAAVEWSVPLIGLVGIVVATAAAWVTVDYSTARWRRTASGRWRAFVAAASIAGVVGLWLADATRDAWSSIEPASPTLGFVSLMALTLGVGPVVSLVRADDVDAADRRIVVGLAVGAVGAVAVGLEVARWVRVGAGGAILVGLGLFTAGFVTACSSEERPASGGRSGESRGSRVLQVVPGGAGARGLVVGAGGAAVVLAGVAARLAPVATVGAWSIVVAMIMLSVRPARFDISTLMRRSVLGAGVALVAVAGYQLYATDVVGRSALFSGFVAASIALVGAWIVWRGATLFLGVVAGFVFCWGLFSTTVDDPARVSSTGSDETGAAEIVAFGDSFMSGEGASEFFAGTDQKGDERNECRRAPTAYPVSIASETDALDGADLDFVACSGARLRDVLDLCSDDLDPDRSVESVASVGVDDCSVEVGDADGARRSTLACSPPVELPLGQYPCGPDGVHGSTLQIEHVPDDRSATRLVLISAGGNDVRFGQIVAGCLLPGNCAERREVWLDNVAAIGPELTETYRRLRSEFGGDTAVVVMPYPLVLTEETCDSSPLDSAEHEFVFEFTTVLNRQLASSARQAGVHYFGDGAFAFEGHRLCESPQRAVNLIRLQPTGGTVVDRMTPASWIHNSMHPNRRGHELTTTALAAWLDRESIVESGNPEPGEAADPALLDVRSARPLPVPPSVAERLRSGELADCDRDAVGDFATRVAVFDEQPVDGSVAEAFRVPLTGADPDSTVCVTDSSGNWIPLTPTEAPSRPSAAPLTRLPSDDPVAEVRDGSVFVSGGRPDDRCTDADADGVEASSSGTLCAFQWILFSSPIQEPASERTWNLRAVRYCSVDPDCDDTFDDWTDRQIARAARRVAPTVTLIFLGGWLLALGVELVFAPRWSAGRLRSGRPDPGSRGERRLDGTGASGSGGRG